MLAHRLGKNLSLDEGNLLRKVLTKKSTGKGHEVKDSIYKKFVEGCTEKEFKKVKQKSFGKPLNISQAMVLTSLTRYHTVCFHTSVRGC